MKILFIIPTLGTGGAERVASILANYLSENNKVEIFVMEKSVAPFFYFVMNDVISVYKIISFLNYVVLLYKTI